MTSVPTYLAFSDQDDIWLPGKLEKAITSLSVVSPLTPALYCARRWVWDPTCRQKSVERPVQRTSSFRNALIENIASGNTIVLNKAGARLVCAAAQNVGTVFAHDWWIYQIITGAGGFVIYDQEPCLLYRQHGQNAIGAGRGLRAQIRRKTGVMQGDFRDRLTLNSVALNKCRKFLTPQNRRVLDDFNNARNQRGMWRATQMAKLAPFRQTHVSSATFWGALLLGKV